MPQYIQMNIAYARYPEAKWLTSRRYIQTRTKSGLNVIEEADRTRQELPDNRRRRPSLAPHSLLRRFRPQ